MKSTATSRVPSRTLHVALAAALCLSCGVAFGQKKDKDKSSAPAPAPAPARSAPAAPPAQRSTTQAAPAHTAPPPTVTHAPTQTPTRPSTPQSGMPSRQPVATPGSPAATPGRGGSYTPQGRGPVGTTPNVAPASGRGAQPTPSGSEGRRFGNPPSAADPRRTGIGTDRPGPAVRPAGSPTPNGPRPPVYRPTIVQTPNGGTIHRDPAGHATIVRTGNTTIVHAPGGAARYEVGRPGGRVIVTNSAGHGYVQRPVVVRGHEYVQRSYYVGGRSYTRVYRPVVYHGVTLQVYTPVRFYTPRYYVWGYTPWRAPVVYNFGWGGSPWLGYYGGYFSPYPSYAAPNYWLTDYMLAMSLQEAYQERSAQSESFAMGQVAMDNRVKNLVAGEVQRQLQQERDESQRLNQNVVAGGDAPPPILAGTDPHVFVVSTSLIANDGSQECALTQGDVLQWNPAPSTDPAFANVQVLASKGQDCQSGRMIPVQLADLQEMQNHMRATIDQGLAELQAKQGQSGLPAIDASMRAEMPAPFAADLPPAETNVQEQLTQQAREAERQEQQLLGQVPGNSAAGQPPTIQAGFTIDQVVQIMGEPLRIADLGQKKTYFYKDMKIIFLDGKVNDVQ
jgi:hypothetical protein